MRPTRRAFSGFTLIVILGLLGVRVPTAEAARRGGFGRALRAWLARELRVRRWQQPAAPSLAETSLHQVERLPLFVPSAVREQARSWIEQAIGDPGTWEVVRPEVGGAATASLAALERDGRLAVHIRRRDADRLLPSEAGLTEVTLIDELAEFGIVRIDQDAIVTQQFRNARGGAVEFRKTQPRRYFGGPLPDPKWEIFAYGVEGVPRPIDDRAAERLIIR